MLREQGGSSKVGFGRASVLFSKLQSMHDKEGSFLLSSRRQVPQVRLLIGSTSGIAAVSETLLSKLYEDKGGELPSGLRRGCNSWWISFSVVNTRWRLMAEWWHGNKTPRRGRTPFRWQQMATLDSNFNVWPVTSKSNKSCKTARTPALESRVTRLRASLDGWNYGAWNSNQERSLFSGVSETRWPGASRLGDEGSEQQR